MGKVAIHCYPAIFFDSMSSDLYRVLCDEKTYNNGTIVSEAKQDGMKYYQLLRGSKAHQNIVSNSKYGYEHNVARKLGKIAGDRFLRDKNLKFTVVKTKANLLKHHHNTVKKIKESMIGGVYQKLHHNDFLIYNVGNNYLFINLNSQEYLTNCLCKQVIQSIVNAYQPEAKLIL